MSRTQKISVLRSTDLSCEITDQVVVEEPLEIWCKYYPVNAEPALQHLTTTMRTPGDDIILVKGWLWTMDVVPLSAVQHIKHTGRDSLRHQESNRVLVTLLPGHEPNNMNAQRPQVSMTSCGICGHQNIEDLLDHIQPLNPEFSVSLTTEQINAMADTLADRQSVFLATGGAHGVALFDQNAKVLDVQEDAGRHNALDKLIGCNMHNIPNAFGVWLSGRVSFDMVQKAARAGFCIIIAVGAPTSLAVALCREFDITLVGFTKASSFNVYCGNARILQ